MADISTAVSMARVPILGEDGRISDDYIPAAIGEGVESAEAAATRAKTAATAAESAKTAAEKARDAAGTAQGGAESAKTAAETAKTAAEKAKADAESAGTAAANSAKKAAGSAQDAQQSATAAQQSAASVADKFITSAQATTLEPGSQATASVDNQVLTIGVPKGDKGDTGEKGDPGVGVPEGGTPGQLLSKTDSGTAWVDPPSTGNVLTGEAEGYVAHAEDAYAQKPIEVRVKGKTVKNLWPVINGSSNGVTVSTGEDGSITLSGTSTDVTAVEVEMIGMAPGKTYAMAADRAIPGVGNGYGFYLDTDVQSAAYVGNSSLLSKTYTVNGAATRVTVGVYLPSGVTVSGTYRLMLVEGSEAPDCFVPTGLHGVEPTNLVTAGKNLLDEDAPAVDGVVGPQLPPGDYALSGTLPSGASLKLLNGGADGETITDASSLPHTFTAGHPFTPYYAGVGGYATGLMLELGSTATAYEPPNFTTTALPEVELRGLPDGTCDELVIAQDGTATVERRTQLTGDDVTALPEPTTEPLSPVTLPVLPAPTFNVYNDSDVPSDITLEYERDVTIAFGKLAKQIAGTASAVAVREASTIEEE